MMFLHLSQKSWASYVGNPFLAVALRYFPRWFNYPLENASIFLAVLASNTVCISWYLYQYFLIPQNSGMQVSRRVTEELVEWLHRQVSEAKNSMLDTGGFLSK